MDLHIEPDGSVRCIYAEQISLAELGRVQIRRASFVEPDADGRWRVDLSPVGGPALGPFERRSDGLAAEHKWLRDHWLCSREEGE